MLKKDDIRIRDPFVFPDEEKKLYYVYGTTELKEGLSAGNKFSVYISCISLSTTSPFRILKELSFGSPSSSERMA